MGPHLNASLRLQVVGGELLALDPAGGIVIRFSSTERTVVERLIECGDGTNPAPVWSVGEHAALGRLRKAGVVVDGPAGLAADPMRRRVLQVGAASLAAAGMVGLVLPSAAAASSAGGVGEGGTGPNNTSPDDGEPLAQPTGFQATMATSTTDTSIEVIGSDDF